MNLAWISQKSAGVMAVVVGLLFLIFSYLHGPYRYFHLCVAVVAFLYGYRQFKKRYTPFERHEKEMRRKAL